MPEEPLSRRRFLLGSGAIVAASATVGGLLAHMRNQVSTATNQIVRALPSNFAKAPALPADPDVNIQGLSTLVTPTKDFFRIDTSPSIPEIDPTSWQLVIKGMVDTPRTISYEELLAMPLKETDATIGCVSNEVGGHLVGNARWIGVSLDDVLDSVKPSSSADQVLSWSSDEFSAGFPLQDAYGRNAIIAVGMNGEPLTGEHGFPARLVVPGLFGYVSATKWLTEIELTRFDKKKGFWITRGWSQLGPVKLESRIDTPSQGQTISAAETHIAGVAWAPIQGINKVEVQVDDGPWQSATLGPAISGATWRQWWLKWTPESGKRRITVRATDGNGQVQTKKVAAIDPDGATGWHYVYVNVM
jgi:DMSO/TMAO reductase YedYZ molybdopterin-dependent catalytic subunit